MHAGDRPALVVPEREIGYVLDEYEAQRDPLDLASRDDPGEDAAAVATLAITGADDDTIHRIAIALRARKLDTIAGLDQLTARLIAWKGIDPLVLAWLAAVSAELGAVRDMAGETVATVDLASSYEDAGSLNHVEISEGVAWFSAGLLAMAPIPDALATAVIGKPLTTLLSHPVLDAHPFVITDIDTDEDRSRIQVSYDDQWIEIRAVTVAELANMLRLQRGETPCAIT